MRTKFHRNIALFTVALALISLPLWAADKEEDADPLNIAKTWQRRTYSAYQMNGGPEITVDGVLND